MPKAPIQIYVRSESDHCAHRDEDGFVCGMKAASHPSWVATGVHAFVRLPSQFVYPTDIEKRKIYEQLKEEFDA